MKKDLAWYLNQELLTEGDDEKKSDKKTEKSDDPADTADEASKEEEDGVHPRYGKRIDARGRPDTQFRKVLQVWRTNQKNMLSWSKPNKVFENLGISKKQDWVQTVEQMDEAKEIGSVFTRSRFIDENTVMFTLAGNWRSLSENTSGAIKFLLFWICEVIRAWNPQLAHTRDGRIAPFSIKGVKFYHSGADQLTVHWENRGY